MPRVLDHGRWIVVTLLLLGGLVVASLCRGDDSERAARRSRLHAFVAATQQAANAATTGRCLPLVAPVDEPADLCLAAAAVMLGSVPRTAGVLEDLEWPDASLDRAAARAGLEPIVDVLRRAAGGRGTCDRNVPQGLFAGVFRVAFLAAGDRAAWREQVELWLLELALNERVSPRRWQAVGASWPDERLLPLDADALRRLAAILAHLDANAPVVWDPAVGLASSVQQLLQRPRTALTSRRLSAWRHGFDVNERELVAADELIAALPELGAADCDWATRDRQWRSVVESVRAGAGAVLPRLFESHRQHERSLRRDLAQLRLLRLCIAWRLGEPLPAVLDPFTLTAFVVEANGDAATFRSPSTQPDLVRGATRLGARELR